MAFDQRNAICKTPYFFQEGGHCVAFDEAEEKKERSLVE